MISRNRLLTALILGTMVAGVAAWVGPLLDPPALARWTVQTHEENYFRAAYALVAIRHLPMFLFAVVTGRLIFRVVKNPSVRMVALTALPWLLYVFMTGVLESLAIGEEPFEWMVYRPAYFIWPHFIAIPAGLYVASRMVHRRK